MAFDNSTFGWLDSGGVELVQAVSNFQHRQYQDAITSSVAVLEVDDRNTDALAIVSLSYLGLHQPKESLTVAKRLVDVAPDDWQSHIIEAHALVEVMTKYGPLAIETATRATQIAPNNEDAFIGLASVASRVAHQQGVEISAVTRALELNPNSRGALGQLGVLHSRRGEWDKAIATYQHGLDAYPDDVILLQRLAAAQQNSGNRKAASDTYAKIAQLEPQDPLLPHSTTLEATEPPPSILQNFRTIYWSLFALLFGFFLLTISAATSPIRFLLVVIAIIAVLTFVTPIRRSLAVRIWPLKMGRAEGRTTWAGRNPDMVYGITTLSILSIYLLAAVLGWASRAGKF